VLAPLVEVAAAAVARSVDHSQLLDITTTLISNRKRCNLLCHRWKRLVVKSGLSFLFRSLTLLVAICVGRQNLLGLLIVELLEKELNKV